MAWVCIIDDDEDIRASLRFLLEEAGYDVVEAREGTQGLSLLETSADPLIVLFDYHTPREHSALLAFADQERHLTERHAFICMTTYREGFSPTLLSLLAQFQVPIIAKPFAIETVLEAVKGAEQRLSERG